MPDADSRMKGLKAKLNALVQCVLEHAQENAAFAEHLHQIFHTDTIPTSKPKTGKAKADKVVLDPVTFLQAHGMEKLRAELNEKAASELSDIVRLRGIVKGRAAKSLERDEMIGKIVEYAEKKLHQGITVAGESGVPGSEGHEGKGVSSKANGEDGSAADSHQDQRNAREMADRHNPGENVGEETESRDRGRQSGVQHG